MAAGKYHPQFHPQLARWIVSYGYSDRELAAELGVHPATIKSWKERYPDFAAAIAESSEQHDRKVECRLLQAALGSEEPVVVEVVESVNEKNETVRRTKKALIKPSLAAQKFWLQHRNAKRWRDEEDTSPLFDDVEFLT